MLASIFWEFALPNSATWFYFSAFLSVALFFQFSRALSLRNFDLLALYLFVPGFLFIQDANQSAVAGLDDRAERYAGYGWLLGASLYWLVRCLGDLAAVRRPLVTPNLKPAGLIWFGAMLVVGLASVAFGRGADPFGSVGRQPAALTGIQERATEVVASAQGGSGGSGAGRDSARFWVERTLAVACHAAVVVGLFLVGYRLFHDLETALAAVTLYLLLPYTAYHVGQVHHVLPAALVLWAVYFYNRPTWAGVCLGLAAGTTFFPLLLVPAWLQFHRKAGVGRFLAGFGGAALVALSATLGALYLAGRFPDQTFESLHLADWQPWRIPSAESIWTGVNWAYRVPVFGLYVIFVLASFRWPRVRNLGHLIAMNAATLIGVQFWFADRGGLYVLWYSPLLVLMVFRPSLTDSTPVPPGPWPSAKALFGRRAGLAEGELAIGF